MSNFWKIREDALHYLDQKYPSRLLVAYKTFEIFDHCESVFEKHALVSDYAQACGLALSKARNLALGSFSLILDGLGQESGALIRPMIECAEVLTYLRLKPQDSSKALLDQLPKAGVRAQVIDSIYKDLREHLNRHASHVSFSPFATNHLFNVDTKKFISRLDLVPNSLITNLRDVVVQWHLLLREAVLAIEQLDDAFFEIAVEWENLKNRTLDVYDLNATSSIYRN